MNDPMTDRQGARLKQAPLLVVVFLAVTFAVTWLAFLPLILRRTHAESTTGTLLQVLGAAPQASPRSSSPPSAPAGKESGGCGAVGPDGGSVSDGMRPC